MKLILSLVAKANFPQDLPFCPGQLSTEKFGAILYSRQKMT